MAAVVEVDVEVAGETRRLHVRGDRSSGLSNRPLRREYEVLALLERHGIPVPKVYGWCADPEAIVMANLPDTPFLGNPDDDPAVHAVVEEYAAVLAAIHRLDVDEFAAAGLYDLELAKIGDPMLDLASMRVRNTYEPIGDVGSVLARYRSESDEPIDGPALGYYTTLLFIAVPMIAGPSLRTVRPHPAYVEYLSWTLASSRGALEAIAECEGFDLDVVDEIAPATTPDGAFDDLIAQCELLPSGGFFREAPALSLARYVRRVQEIQSTCNALEVEEASELIGGRLDDPARREAALRQFVIDASPEHVETLTRLFHRRTMRQLQLLRDYPAPIVDRGLAPVPSELFSPA